MATTLKGTINLVSLDSNKDKKVNQAVSFSSDKFQLTWDEIVQAQHANFSTREYMETYRAMQARVQNASEKFPELKNAKQIETRLILEDKFESVLIWTRVETPAKVESVNEKGEKTLIDSVTSSYHVFFETGFNIVTYHPREKPKKSTPENNEPI